MKQSFCHSECVNKTPLTPLVKGEQKDFPLTRGIKGVNNFAFTLIELLIAVTIVGVVGITAISGFSRMTEVQDAETTVKIISDTLESFERKVLRHQIVSYDAVFESGSLGFATNLDWYKKNPSLAYSFDFQTGTGNVQGVGTSTGMADMHFSGRDEAGENRILPMDGGVQTFSFPPDMEKRWYQISGEQATVEMNSYEMQYYNLTDDAPEKEVRLVKIVGTDGTLYSSLLVRNVLGERMLQGSGATLDTLEKVTLLFEKNGKEAELKLVK